MNDKILQEYKDFVWGEHANRNTRLTYTDHPRVFLNYFDKPLEDLTQKDVNNFVQDCYENRRHNGNAIRFWSVNKFLNWAEKNELILPKITPEDAGKQALSEEDEEKLLSIAENLSSTYRLVFYLLHDTLRRPSEIRKLKKNGRYGHILKYDGKTGIKACVMTDRLQQAWDDYIKNERSIPATPEEDEYLLLNNYAYFKGHHLKTNVKINRIVKEILMYAQVNMPHGEKPTTYLIKRTSITRQLKECPDPKIIMTQAGHTKIETTMKYNRINEDDIKEYLNTFEHKSSNIKAKSKICKDKSF